VNTNVVHESDFVWINCTIDYRGRWMPAINCTPELQRELVNETVNETRWGFDRVTYKGVVAAADIGDRAVISCETRFVWERWEKLKSGTHLEFIDKIPSYHHVWNTLIRVYNTTGNWPNMTRSPSVIGISQLLVKLSIH